MLFMPHTSYSNQTDYSKDESYVEKAKLEITKMLPSININDLDYLKSRSGDKYDKKKRGNKLFYPHYFNFKVRSSILTEHLEDQIIEHFDLILVGIYADGNFMTKGESVMKTKATSLNPESEKILQKEPSDGARTKLDFTEALAEDLVYIYGDFSNLEVEGYFGPKIFITCFTEAFIPQKFSTIIIERALANKNISLIKTGHNKVKAVYKKQERAY